MVIIDIIPYYNDSISYKVLASLLPSIIHVSGDSSLFIRNERSIKEFMSLYPIVSVLVIINIILWAINDLLQLQIGRFIEIYGIGFNAAIADGQWWRIITPIFLHGGLMHMLFNSFSLVLFGPALEQMLGKFKFILAYLGTAITANIAIFFLQPMNYAHLGASGAIFGLFGIYVFMVMYRKDLIDQSSSQMIAVIVGIGLVMTFIRPNISILGHLFGFLSGIIYAPLLLRNVASYFPWIRRRTKFAADDDAVQFDPNRWRRKKRIPPFIRKNLLWIIIGFFVLLGILGRMGIL